MERRRPCRTDIRISPLSIDGFDTPATAVWQNSVGPGTANMGAAVQVDKLDLAGA